MTVLDAPFLQCFNASNGTDTGVGAVMLNRSFLSDEPANANPADGCWPPTDRPDAPTDTSNQYAPGLHRFASLPNRSVGANCGDVTVPVPLAVYDALTGVDSSMPYWVDE